MNEFVDSVHQTIIQIFFFSTHTQTLHTFSKEFAFALIFLSRFHVKMHFISFENDIIKLDFIFLAFNRQKCSKLAFVFATILPEIFKNSSKTYSICKYNYAST